MRKLTMLCNFIEEIEKGGTLVEVEELQYISGVKASITFDTDLTLIIDKNMACDIYYPDGLRLYGLALSQAIHNIKEEL